MTERWRWVPGYEEIYEVSDMGRVRTYVGVGKRRPHSTPQAIRRPNRSSKGYLWLVLRKGDGRRKYVGVHTLVLLAFVGPRPSGQEARHLDGDKENNRLTNLAWGTHRENEQDKVRQGRPHGPRGARHGNAKLSGADVRRMRRLHSRGFLQRVLARRFGVSQSTVSGVVNGASYREEIAACAY